MVQPGDKIRFVTEAALADSTSVVRAPLNEDFIMRVAAGTNLAAPRPAGAGRVYWEFAAGVNVGEKGVNIVNRVAGDQFFVADA